MHEEIHSFTQCLFSTFCVLGIVLSTKFSHTQDRNGLCPQQVGRLAGKTNLPTEYQQMIFKDDEKRD